MLRKWNFKTSITLLINNLISHSLTSVVRCELLFSASIGCENIWSNSLTIPWINRSMGDHYLLFWLVRCRWPLPRISPQPKYTWIYFSKKLLTFIRWHTNLVPITCISIQLRWSRKFMLFRFNGAELLLSFILCY